MNDIKRGEMFYISRGGASYNGSEQHADRPAVVVSNNKNNENSNVVEVVYMTTQPKTDLPTHVTIRSTGRISTVLCEQVYSVSTERIGTYIGEATDKEMENIDIALMISLQLDNGMGFDSISVTQTAKELNDATVDFRLEILAGNVEIEGMEVGKEGNKIVVPVDSLLVWSIANAKTISNNYGEIKIDKDITTERIDPIDAIIDAWKHAMKEEYRPDVNETVNEWLEQYEKYMKKGGEK